ncbi:MAG: hypothetical protein K2W96_02105, partial [Gemmataceae bacterium]|nr:hypothetical protein [Gemmataceae bacterium]
MWTVAMLAAMAAAGPARLEEEQRKRLERASALEKLAARSADLGKHAEALRAAQQALVLRQAELGDR